MSIEEIQKSLSEEVETLIRYKGRISISKKRNKVLEGQEKKHRKSVIALTKNLFENHGGDADKVLKQVIKNSAKVSRIASSVEDVAKLLSRTALEAKS